MVLKVTECLAGGDDIFRNLSFAANSRIIGQDYFQQKVIPRQAAALADRLTSVLRPLFALQKPQHEWSFDVSAEWRSQKSRLCSIFEAALRVKTESVISEAIFEVDLPQSGSEYVADQMDSSEAMLSAKQGEQQKHVVLASLVPGLRAFTHKPKLVDYDNFRQPDSDPGADFGHIKRPVVFLCHE